jgi:hypothetical protein
MESRKGASRLGHSSRIFLFAEKVDQVYCLESSQDLYSIQFRIGRPPTCTTFKFWALRSNMWWGVAKLRCRKGLAPLGAKLLVSRRMKRSEALFTQHDADPILLRDVKSIYHNCVA